MIEQTKAEFANIQIQFTALMEENSLFKEKIRESAIFKKKPKIDLLEKFDRDKRHFRRYIIGMRNYFVHYREEFLQLANQI